MKPYKFEPYLKTTIWGGYRIAPFKGIYTAQLNIGESWEISGVLGYETWADKRYRRGAEPHTAYRELQRSARG